MKWEKEELRTDFKSYEWIRENVEMEVAETKPQVQLGDVKNESFECSSNESIYSYSEESVESYYDYVEPHARNGYSNT